MAGDEGEGAAKRPRPSLEGPAAGAAEPSLSRRGLLLSMDYEAAAESINLELLAGRSK